MSRDSSHTGRPRTTPVVVASWLAVVVVAAAIFWMSANTGQDVNEHLGVVSAVKGMLASLAAALFGHEVDVSPVGHFAEYLVFGGVLFNALRFHVRPRHALWLAFALGSAYGVTDELHQLFVPGRSCDPLDWAVDSGAALLGACAARGVVRRSRPRA